MATVTFDFTSLGAGSEISLIKDDKFSYAVAGTFVGTVVLEQSTDGGATYKQIGDPISAAISSVLTVNYGGSNSGVYRFRCTEYTSGTIETTLSDVDLSLFDVKDFRGNQVFKVTEAGIETVGTILQNGTPVGGNQMETDFSNADPAANAIDLGSNLINNVADPVSAQDAVTLQYFNDNLPAAGADRNLSNLLSPVQLTQSLTPSVDTGVNLGSPTRRFEQSYVSFKSTVGTTGGTRVEIDNNGVESFNGTFSLTSNGSMVLNSNNNSISVNSGSGSLSLSGQGVSVTSNDTTTMTLNGTTNISATSGPFSINNTDSGINLNAVEQIQLSSSANDVRLLTTSGSIRFLSSSSPAPSIGDVWTATSTNGNGYWAAPAGGGDAWSDPVDSTIAPAGANDGAFDLGAPGQEFGELYAREIHNTVNNSVALSFNTTSQTTIHNNFLPSSGGSYDLGSTNFAFRRLYLRSIDDANEVITSFSNSSNAIVYTTRFNVVGAAFPDGNARTISHLMSRAGEGFAIVSAGSSNATETGELAFLTGNNTSTGDSGDINLRTGSTTTGTRGKIKLDALMATMPTGTADPTGEDTGDCYYKTDTKELRIYDGTGWVGVTLA